MGQFKPMVKMMTTEPSVELKLKKGGSVKSTTKMKTGGTDTGHKKMADGGSAMGALLGSPALVGRPAVNAPVRTPGKPSMSARRKAMAAKPKAPVAPMMKKGGKAEGESKAEHKSEMAKFGKIEKELKSHEGKPASKAHKGLKTGGVALGNAGGYKKGGNVNKYAKGGLAGNGIINTENQGGEYRNTKMHSAEKTTKTSGKTGGVKNGNGGGYKTGGVALGNGGGYKKGGATKKFARGGSVIDDGKAQAMPQGRKKPSAPVSINRLSGTFKKGGKVTPAEGRLMKDFDKENATAMREAKAQSNEIYSKYQKFAKGGVSDKENDMSNGAYDAHYANERAENEADRKMMTDALMYLPRQAKKAFDSLRGQGAVTTTEREISKTVSPAKKRSGGSC
jgi:hypothetical protein